MFLYARQMEAINVGLPMTESVLTLKIGERKQLFFFRFENYLWMLCLKMEHLGRVRYCFERHGLNNIGN